LECPDGVCLESQGVCAAEGDVVYVRADGSDTGSCTSTAPCLTLGYAFQQLAESRHVVHLFGTTLNMGSTTIALPFQTTYIDGEDTALQFAGSGAAFSKNGGTTQVSHVAVGRSTVNSFSITSGTLDLFGVDIKGPVVLTGGVLDITSSVLERLGALGIQCSNGGVITVRASNLHGGILTTDCPATVQGNRIDDGGGLALSGSSIVTVENNVITSTDYFTDPANVGGAAGSSLRFNTFVNLSGVDMGATPLYCSGAVDVSSNIFAWHSSTAPSGCSPRYCLFDQIVGLQPGTGNRVGDASTFFVDLQGSDFHLAPSSPAIDGAEPGLPTAADIDGHTRPNGSAADIGAYEAP
jgi:hypothetical protein